MVEPTTESVEPFIACSKCFSDQGLILDAIKRGTKVSSSCPNCSAKEGRKLTETVLRSIAHDYFVRGSTHRSEYGGASVIYANEHKPTDINFRPPLQSDVPLIERLTKLGFFRSAPRLWLLGHITPLQQLKAPETRHSVISRILDEYPAILVYPQELSYRIRKTPNEPEQHHEYDARPQGVSGDYGRFDSAEFPAMYASPDLKLCIHECRVTAEDELYVATINPTRPLRCLNLCHLLDEPDNPSEFESLDMAMYMLFLADDHSYEITRDIAVRAKERGYDAVVYPSYFTYLRMGVHPFQTFYGLSVRRVPGLRQLEKKTMCPNIAIFGRPIQEGLVSVKCLNRIVLKKVDYDYHFGPVGYE